MAILNIQIVHYCCNVYGISKSEAAKCWFDLEKEEYYTNNLLSHIKWVKKLTFGDIVVGKHKFHQHKRPSFDSKRKYE